MDININKMKLEMIKELKQALDDILFKSNYDYANKKMIY